MMTKIENTKEFTKTCRTTTHIVRDRVTCRVPIYPSTPPPPSPIHPFDDRTYFTRAGGVLTEVYALVFARLLHYLITFY